jgi:hypothetical protein
MRYRAACSLKYAHKRRRRSATVSSVIAGLKPGDHVRYCILPGIYHHLIVDEGLTAIHLSGSLSYSHGKSVRRESLGDVLRRCRPETISLVCRPTDPIPVLGRAHSALNGAEWVLSKYGLLRNNCEHFAQWCIGGWRWSKQVTKAGWKLLASGCILLWRGATWVLWGIGSALGGTGLVVLALGSGVICLRNYGAEEESSKAAK